MNTPDVIQVKFLSSPDFIEELKNDGQASPDDINVVSSGPEKDQTSLEFGLAEVTALIAFVKGAYWVSEMSVKIYRWLRSDKNRRIVVQTPLGRWEFVSRDDITEEEVRDILKQLGGIGR